MKSWLDKNAIEMYSAHCDEKSVIAEKLIRLLKNKIVNIRLQYEKMLILIN